MTRANEPAREDTMRCAALRSRAASGSTAKSFNTSSRDVMHAIVTERSTTGETISRTALVSATGRSLASARRTFSGRFGAGAILTCCCMAAVTPPDMSAPICPPSPWPIPPMPPPKAPPPPGVMPAPPMPGS